jgi:hypothetical protein
MAGIAVMRLGRSYGSEESGWALPGLLGAMIVEVTLEAHWQSQESV